MRRSCIAAVTGAWQYEGGGAFHNNGAIYQLDADADRQAHDVRRPARSACSTSRQIGAILTGDADALCRAARRSRRMLIQNTNPACVAPEQTRVREGFAREDLFVVVHEQFMTETAQHGRHRAAGDHVPRA